MWYFDYLDDEDEREQEILDALRAEEEAKIEAAERAELEAEEARIAEMLAEKPDWLKHEEEEAAERKAKWAKICEQEKANHFNYAVKEKIVKSGNSEIFKYWHERGVSEEDFLNGLKWVCDDPLYEDGKLTRELGCERDGKLVKLKRIYDRLTGQVILLEEEGVGELRLRWTYGVYYDEKTGFIRSTRYSINARDDIKKAY